jgi:acetyl-CoA carboxylase carboxyl transferase subunit alpha
MKLIDAVITEPLGGAHRNIHDTVYNVEQYIIKTLRELQRTRLETLLDKRYERLRFFGTPSSEQLRRRTAQGRERIKAAVEGVALPTKKQPTKV